MRAHAYVLQVWAEDVKKHVEGMKKRPTDTVRCRKLRVSVGFLPLVADGSGIRHLLLHECQLKSNLASRFARFALQFDPRGLIIELRGSHCIGISFFGLRRIFDDVLGQYDGILSTTILGLGSGGSKRIRTNLGPTFGPSEARTKV